MIRMMNAVPLFFLSCVLVCGRSETGAVEFPSMDPIGKNAALTSDILLKYDIITEADVAKDEFITYYEALDVIRKIMGGSHDKYNDVLMQKEWYRGDSLASLDYLDDDHKWMLMISREGSILKKNDFFEIDLAGNITFFKSLQFILRMIADTYGCVIILDKLDYEEKAEAYETAYKKGLIGDPSMENADAAIQRKFFYELACRAIDIEHSVGGYAPTTMKYLDLLRKRTLFPSKSREPVLVGSTELRVNYAINDDLSISWTLPPAYRFLSEADLLVDFGLTTKDGSSIKCVGFMASFKRYEAGIGGQDVVDMLASAYPEKPEKLRVRCTKHNDNYSEEEEWFFDVGLSDIDVAIEGEPVEPGEFTPFHGQWVPKSMTLEDRREFQATAWYFLTSYEHQYRRPEYNSTSHAIFKVREDADIVNNENKRLKLNSGGLYLEDIRIQEIQIGRNSRGGLKLSITPESKGNFTVMASPPYDRW